MTEPAYTANWHTHTFRCKHASGDAEDYARAAADAGLKTLGFTDHMPTPDNRWSSVRMPMEALVAYREAVSLARQRLPDLNIYCGLECEYHIDWRNFYVEALLGQGMEFLTLAAHSFPLDGNWTSAFSRERANDPVLVRAYADYLIDGIGTGLFTYVAHPDLFGFFYDSWDRETLAASRDIAQAARDARVPLEINAYGFRKPAMKTPQGMRPTYPWEPFWQVVADVGARAVVNSDAHHPRDIVGAVDQACSLARRTGVHLVMPETLEAWRHLV